MERAEAAGITLVVHENFRFMPWYREAKRLIEAGAFGRLLNVGFRLRPADGQGPRAYLDRQPYFQAMPRFLIHETAIHLIDVFRYLCGEVAGVFARLRRLNPAIRGEDAGYVLFDFASGAAGLFDGNRLTGFAAANPRLTMGEMWLEGEAATLRLDGDGRLFLRPHQGIEREHAYAWQNTGFGGDCVLALQRHVLAHLADGTPLENDGRAYLTQSRDRGGDLPLGRGWPLAAPGAGSDRARLDHVVVGGAHRGIVGGEEQHHAGEIDRLDQVGQALLAPMALERLGRRPELLLALGHDPARHHGVDPDAVRAEIAREARGSCRAPPPWRWCRPACRRPPPTTSWSRN